MPNTINVFDLEKILISDTDTRWKTIPEKIHKQATKYKDSGSVGIGFDHRLGWFILITAGQGPILAWSEK